MSIKKKIVRILLLFVWVTLSAGVLVLLVAANKIKSNKNCKGIEIEISGVEALYFLDREDVLAIIAREGANHPEGKAVAGFDLRKLESLLKQNIWVKDAELFFDNNLVLHVNIFEREPIARIITTSGASFYLDSSGYKMPLSKKMIVKLPVFTGYTSGNADMQGEDSVLLQDVKKVAWYILKDEFWMAQIAQVDILPDRSFEMVPTIGNHIIQFGHGEDFENKFKRLFIFYRQVLGNKGFDKYSRLNVQYDQQLVATAKEPMSKNDSLRAAKNIEKMIMDAGTTSGDSTTRVIKKDLPKPAAKDSTSRKKIIPEPSTLKVQPVMKKTSTPGTQPAATLPAVKAPATSKETKPKAVMRKIEQKE